MSDALTDALTDATIHETLALLLQRVDALGEELAKKDEMLRQIHSVASLNEFMLRRIFSSQAVYMGNGTALTYDKGGRKIYVDTASGDIGTHVVMGGNWEDAYMQMFERLLFPGAVVFDIGANIGIYTLAAATAVGPTGQVHAFEPNPRLARLAGMSASVNGFADFVQVHQLALSDCSGEAELKFHHFHSGGATLGKFAPPDTRIWHGRESASITCQTKRADDLFPDLAKVDVIKMDVEGYEGHVVQGMRELLQRSPDVKMMIEWCPGMLDRSGVSAVETASLLRELGFRPWQMLHEGRINEASWDDLVRPDLPLQNLLVARQ